MAQSLVTDVELAQLEVDVRKTLDLLRPDLRTASRAKREAAVASLVITAIADTKDEGDQVARQLNKVRTVGGLRSAYLSETLTLAQQTVTFVDDIDGSAAAETVSFAIDGGQYEIDLSKRNAAALRKALAEYVGKGRVVRQASVIRRARTSTGQRGRGKAKTTAPAAESRSEIREWAQQQGIAISSRGPIASTVLQQFEHAHA